MEIIQSKWITQCKMSTVPRSRIFSLGTKLYSTSVRVTVRMCALCKWRPEVGNGVFLNYPLPYILRQSFFLNLELTDSAGLGRQGGPLISPGARGRSPWLPITWVLGDQTQVLLLVGQALYWLSHYPSLYFLVSETIERIQYKFIKSKKTPA